MKAIKDFTLVVDGRLRRVEILGLSFLDDPSAETHDALIEVKDRKDNPPPKRIIPAFLLFGKDEPEFPGHLE